MESRPLSPAVRPSGRFVCLAVACGVLLGAFTLPAGSADAAGPALPAGGSPGALVGNPVVGGPLPDDLFLGDAARDMNTGDEPELAGPALPVARPAAAPARPAGVTSLANRHLGSLIDREVVAPDGSHVGQVIDVLLDQDGHPAAAVVDVGGFMGVGNRRVAIAWDQFVLGGMTEKSPVKLRLSAAEVRSAPSYDASSMNVTVVHGPPPPPPAAPAASAPADAEPPPVSVEAQPQPAPPLLPDSAGQGSRGDAPAETRPASPHAGLMAR